MPKKTKTTVLKNVKAKKGKKLWTFTEGFQPNTSTEDTLYYTEKIWRVPSLNCNGKRYEVEKMHFYDKDGVVYSIPSVDFADETRKALVTFDQCFSLKRKAKYDGKLFILSHGKDYWDNALKCDLYIPIRYLESIGYKVVEEVKPGYAEKYQVDTEVYLQSPHFTFRLSYKRKDNFAKRKKDLIEAIKKAESSKDFEKALKEIMSFHRVEVRDLKFY